MGVGVCKKHFAWGKEQEALRSRCSQSLKESCHNQYTAFSQSIQGFTGGGGEAQQSSFTSVYKSKRIVKLDRQESITLKFIIPV